MEDRHAAVFEAAFGARQTRAIAFVGFMAGGDRAAARDAVFFDLVGDDHEPAHAFGRHLARDHRHRQMPVDRLAARHRDRIVVKDFVGDVDAGRDARAHREIAAMKISAVAQIGEHMRLVGERRLADPGHAFAAHLGEGFGMALGHPDRHVMAADAGQRARAFGHMGAGVVRAARTEHRLAFGRRAVVFQRALLGFDDGQARVDARAHLGRQFEAFEPVRDRFGDQRGREFVMRGQ